MAAALLPGRAGAPPAAAPGEAPPRDRRCPSREAKGSPAAMGRGRARAPPRGTFARSAKNRCPAPSSEASRSPAWASAGVGVPGAANDADALKGLLGIGGAAASAPAASPQPSRRRPCPWRISSDAWRACPRRATRRRNPRERGTRGKNRARTAARTAARRRRLPSPRRPRNLPPEAASDPAAFWTALAGGCPPARAIARAGRVHAPSGEEDAEAGVPPPNAKPSTSAPS